MHLHQDTLRAKRPSPNGTPVPPRPPERKGNDNRIWQVVAGSARNLIHVVAGCAKLDPCDGVTSFHCCWVRASPRSRSIRNARYGFPARGRFGFPRRSLIATINAQQRLLNRQCFLDGHYIVIQPGNCQLRITSTNEGWHVDSWLPADLGLTPPSAAAAVRRSQPDESARWRHTISRPSLQLS